MSTNDMVVALANGAAGAADNRAATAPAYAALESTLTSLCADLARGHRRRRRGGHQAAASSTWRASPSATMARDLARAVAGGSLVKSGIFGGDPSWGRILAALGARIGARGFAIDPARRHAGHPGDPRLRARAARSSSTRRRSRTQDAGGRDRRRGWTWAWASASARALGCDLTFDYVKINAEYYSGPRAPAARRRRAARPGVNRPVIVEALSYIRKFAGKRAVIKYGGAAMIDPALKRSFAEEMVLLQSAGPAAGHRPRRRPRDHQDAGEDGAQVGVRRRPADHRRARRSRWSRWC